MRIVFNLQGLALSNNGGSRTLIKCAETLQELGADVKLCSPIYKYSWHKISVEVVKKIPKCDVLVATGYGSVRSTRKFKKASRKFYYIRGFERWVTTEKNLVRSYCSLRCIVNSKWLQEYLSKCGVASDLVYPGLDFDDFRNNNEERSNIVGGIFSKKHKTKRHEDVVKIAERCNREYLLLNKHIKNPGKSALKDFYNKIKVWISPSELEGLHNCPMEAALCGCALVCTDHSRGGVADYAEHKKTALVYPARNLKKAAKYVQRFLDNEELRVEMNRKLVERLRERIGDRASNMARFLEIVSK